MAKGSDNVFPKVILGPLGAPTTPSDSSWKIYAMANGVFAKSSNTTVGPFGTSGSSATYSDYVPALTAASVNPTLGSGSVSDGRYTQFGSHVEGDAYFQFGSSGVAAGTGAYRVSLPVNALTTALSFVAIGYAYLFDSSSGTLSIGVCSRVSTSTIQIIQHSNANPVGAASPWTWSTDDVIIVHFAYEAA